MAEDKYMFRALKENEIDVRCVNVAESGLNLLLYKDARVDQNMLDETVGPMRWKREHSRDNANCTVSIWNDEIKQWISKEDVGSVCKDGFGEDEKALASDSFKRACFSWGIGRELYTAPKHIRIKAEDCNIKQGSDGKYVCYDKFYVEQLIYDESRNIVALSIRNATKDNKRVFLWDGRPKKADKAETTSK